MTRPCAERQEGRNACDSSTRVGAEQSNMGEGLGIMKRCIHSFTHIPAGRRGCRISAPGRERRRRRRRRERRRWILLLVVGGGVMMSEPDGGGGRLVDGVALRAGITHFPPFACARTVEDDLCICLLFSHADSVPPEPDGDSAVVGWEGDQSPTVDWRGQRI